jgi:pilus assembly protein Flp/PilA
MLTFIKTFARDESGATAIEYGLIAALIAVVIIGGVTALGENIDAVFDDVASEIQPGGDGG